MRNKTLKTDIIITTVILLLIAGGIITAMMSSRRGDESGSSQEVTAEVSLSDFNGMTAGVQTGSFLDQIIRRSFPDSDILDLNNPSDLLTSLRMNKIDYFLSGRDTAEIIKKDNPDLTYIDLPVETLYVRAFFPKTEAGDKLRAQLDEYITKLGDNGDLDKMYDYWKSDESSGDSVDMSGLTDINGTIDFANDPIDPPYSFISNGEFAGIEPEIMAGFCRDYGYALNLISVDLSGMIPGVETGMYDVAMGGIVITDERRQSVNFSVPYNSGELVLVTLKENEQSKKHNTAPGSVEDRPFSYYAENRKIGAITGGLYELMIRERYPGADISQFNNQTDMAAALGAGVIDAFTCPESTAKDFMKADPSLTYLKEVFAEIPYGFAFEKTKEKEYLRDQMNEFLKKLHSDGTYDELVSKWFGDDESVKTVDMSGLTGENGSIRYITAPTMPPFSYIANGNNAGLEIDMTVRFCREYGYSLTIENAEFASLIPGITSGMYDIASGTIMITPERAESVNFSDVYYTANAVAVVKRENISSESDGSGFFRSIAESFEKNFIRENRWQLIAEGIGTTCVITLMSTLFGSILAFGICMFRRTGSALANAVSNIYVKLLQGTPIVVLLMILYYVLLGKSGLPAVWVAVIGFSLNFGAYASEIMRSGIDSIDAGQREAALALGYSENQAFFRFIFPQAVVRFLPVYNGEIISLLKGTSVVGYIAIQDLTKMSDIIRSRTYEAFFPLIATAIIYFVLAWIISLILRFILKRVSPKSKKHTSG